MVIKKRVIPVNISIFTGITLFFLVLMSFNGYSQILNWANDLSGSDSLQATAVKTDASGNIYITGNFNSSGIDFNRDGTDDIANADAAGGTYDIFLAKFNAAGTYITAIDIGGMNNDYGEDLALDNTGHIVLVGYFTSTGMDFNSDGFYEFGGVAGNNVGFVAYLNPDFSFNTGTTLDNGYSIARAVTINKFNNIFVTGEFSGTTYFGTPVTSRNSSIDAFLVKFSTSLSLNFVVTFGGDGKDAGLGITSDPVTGNVALTGYFSGPADLDDDNTTGPGGYESESKGGIDLFLIKWNYANGYIWSQTIGGTGGDEGRGVAIDSTGNIYVTGPFNSSVNIDSNPTNDLISLGNNDVLVAKYNDLGTLSWARSLGTVGKDFGTSLALSNNGDVNVAGSEATHLFLAKLTADGQVLRNRIIPGSGIDVATDTDLDPRNGDILLTGSYTSPALDLNSDGSADLTLNGNQDGFLLQFKGTPSATSALPDLIPKNQSASPKNIFPGSSCKISVDIFNQGTADMSGNSKVIVYLSLDSLIDTKDSLLISFPISGITKNTSLSLDSSFQFKTGIPPKEYVLLFQVDPNDVIYETNESNNLSAYLISIKTPDTTPPDISFTGSIPTSILKDTGKDTVRVTITDASGINDAGFYYKKILSPGTTWIRRDLVRSVDNTFGIIVPATDLDEIGIEYFIAAQDSALNQDSTVHKYIYLNYGNTESITGLGVGSTQADYRMFSIPFKLSNSSVDSIFFNKLGAYDKSKWRLFEYSGDQYRELSSSSASLARGQGYWLIKTTGGDIPLKNAEAPNDTPNKPYTINLKAGWNLIGNPYPFDISWPDILTANGNPGGVGNLNFWNGTNYDTNNTMNKYQAAFVTSDNTISLVIPLKKNNARIAGNNENNTFSKSIDGNSWLVQLRLSSDNIYNNYGGVGMNPQASAGPDRYDLYTIPPFGSYLNLNHDGEKFYGSPITQSIVPDADSFSWNFSVSTSIKNQTITISWDNSSFSDDRASLWLYDMKKGQRVNMRTVSTYSFKASDNLKFRIDYFKDGESRGPKLDNPSPNPFSDYTRLGLNLGKNESNPVNIIVYNSLGAKVRTIYNGNLPCGPNELIWNGRDTNGHEVPAGMYFITINVNGNNIPVRSSFKVIKK